MLANVVTKTARDRWKGMAIGAGALALFLLFGMAVYRDIDLSVYTDLPEAMRAVMGIGDGADAAALAYGVVYGSYGAMTLAGLALSMGSASIAGEERDGSIGLLLGNPVSRTHVLGSKAASMVLLTGFGALILWGIGRVAPVLLDVSVSGMHVEALAFHMFINALFYGFAAMALGAWTGNRGLASGATAGVMVVSFFAAGLFPVVEGLENLAKAFPWYYFDGGEPIINGMVWGHLGVLVVGCVLLGATAVIGVNRRDLRGHTVGVTMVDRLRSNPITQKLADRLAGSTRVSRISIKTASDHQGLFLVTAATMFFVMGVLIGPMFNFIDEALRDFSDTFPEALMAMVGGGDMGTPEGWYQVETFGMMAPIAVMLVTIAIGARALAGEEASRTMGLLLANPISRSTVVIEKTVAMVALAALLGIATFAGVALGSLLGGLGISMGNIAAITFLVTLLGLVFGALALAISAGTGQVKVAIFGTVGVALAAYVANGFLPLNDSLAGYAKWSPFYYYMGSEPLLNGMHWGHAAVLAGLFVALVALSIALFDRRDLRQTG